MFQNGKIQMTGCKSLEQARGAVQFLLRKLLEKAGSMRLKRDSMTQLRCFFIGGNIDAASALRTITQPIIPCKQFSLLQSKTDVLREILLRLPNEALFSCRRVSTKFRQVVQSAEFWSQKCIRELRCTVLNDKKKGWHMTTKYNGRFQRMERVRAPEHFAHPRLLYCRYKSLRRHRPFLVVEQYEQLFVAGEQIAMINSDFKTKFDINLRTLFKILHREYGNNGPLATTTDGMTHQESFEGAGQILHAHYSPDDYVAINVKYLSPIPQEPVPSALESDELTEFKKTVISFFIFRTGSVIINSARSIAQQTDAYDFINRVFRKHYERIWHAPVTKKKKRTRRKKVVVRGRRRNTRRLGKRTKIVIHRIS